jgi:hypothetical protein
MQRTCNRQKPWWVLWKLRIQSIRNLANSLILTNFPSADTMGYKALNPYQIRGETKLRTWKLRRRVWAAWSPLCWSPKSRSKKAAKSRASVANAIKFQNEKARQVTKRRRIKNYPKQLEIVTVTGRTLNLVYVCWSIISWSARIVTSTLPTFKEDWQRQDIEYHFPLVEASMRIIELLKWFSHCKLWMVGWFSQICNLPACEYTNKKKNQTAIRNQFWYLKKAALCQIRFVKGATNLGTDRREGFKWAKKVRSQESEYGTSS